MAISNPGLAKEVLSINNNVVVIIKTITLAEETAKQLTLAIEPTDPSKVIMDIIGGTPQAFGTDFTVAGVILSWNGLTLETVLAENDLIRISYPL